MTDNTCINQVELENAVAEYLERLDRGEPIDKAAFLLAHPEIADGLADFFSQERAAKRIAVIDTPGGGDCPTLRNEIQVRCPHCHSAARLAVDSPLADLDCPCCRSRFSLASNHSQTPAACSITKMAQFELIERLGVGGFGTVWKARDTKLDRVVAIKVPRRAQVEPDDAEKFVREARAVAQLRHPNIVTVYEVGRDGDTLYMVSELIRGVTLSDWLTGRQPSQREAAKLCMTIAEVLHHAHERGVIHRDLKPNNIMVDSADKPYLMDFGLARRETEEHRISVGGQILGTPAYMSPEQARGMAHTADGRSDVYSVGVVLYELITGNLPFQGNSRMLLHQVLYDQPPRPRKLNKCVPKDLETITLKCLEKDPASRYSTAAELANDLRCFLERRLISARPTSRLAHTIRWGQRNIVLALLTLALMLTLTSAAAITSTIAMKLTQQKELQHQQLVEHLTVRLFESRTESLPVVLDDIDKFLDEASPILKERLRQAIAVRDHDGELLESLKRLVTDDPNVNPRLVRMLTCHPESKPRYGIPGSLGSRD